MFVFGVLVGFLTGVLLVIAQDFNDAVRIVKKYGKDVKNVITRQEVKRGEVLKTTPEQIREEQEKEQAEKWYG